MHQALDISGNKLTKMEVLVNLKAIEELRVAHNNITELPENIHRLKQLIVLDFSGNQIRSIPSTINRCV